MPAIRGAPGLGGSAFTQAQVRAAMVLPLEQGRSLSFGVSLSRGVGTSSPPRVTFSGVF